MTEGKERWSPRRLFSEAVCRGTATEALLELTAALLLAYVYRSYIDTSSYWLTGLIAAEVLWLGGALLFQRASSSSQASSRWSRLNVFLAAATGAVWGGWSAFVLLPASGALQSALLVTALLLVSLSGLLARTYCAWGGTLFVWLVTAPVAVILLQGDNEQQRLLGLLLLSGAVLLSLTMRLLRRKLLQQRATEQQLSDLLRRHDKREAYFRHARQVADLGTWEWDVASDSLHWSDEARKLFGLPAAGTLTRQEILAAVYWSDRGNYQKGLDDALAGARELEREYRVLRPDGSVRVMREAGEVLRDEHGGALTVLGVLYDITGKVTAARKTRNAFREFNRMLNHMQDTYFRADPAGRLTLVSASMEKLLGYRPHDCLGLRIADLYAVSRHGQTFLIDLHTHGGRLHNYEMQMRHKEGRRVWVSVNAQFIRDESERATGIEGTIRDITELKEAQQALHKEKERALVTLQSIGDGVITTDEAGQIQYLNPTAERLLGYSADAAAGAYYMNVLKLVDEATGESLGDLVKLCLTLETGVVHADEGLLIQPGGARFHLKVTAAPMRDHYGHVVGAVLALHDITEAMGMARQLSYQATHDMLTGLKNRRVFERRVEEAIRDAHNNQGNHVLFYLDLDQFKVVNDTCGHKAGDELLQQIALLMQDKVRDTDVLARLGGDEFGVLLDHCPLDKARDIAEAIRLTIRDFRFVWSDKAFDIGVSIGVVPIDANSGNLADVLAAADAACYVAKDSGRNRLHVYQPDDDAVAQRHGEMEWVHRLSSAFDNDRFLLYAQPVAHVAGDRVVSHYEILLRMLDEKGRVVPPGAFLPAAERYNLMPTIDRWVIRETFEQMRIAQGQLAFPPVECAINLSGQSLCDEHFLEYVVDLFDETGIPCESICFEVTETAAIANLTRATRFITVLRGMGCSFALDDFGAGLSSFGYLKSLPVDYLKIDGGFVRDMVVDRVDRAMVESINQIGHVMGLKTIGEFAEDEAVVIELERAGVDFAQGSAIAPPRPLEQVLEKETRQLRRAAPDAG